MYIATLALKIVRRKISSGTIRKLPEFFYETTSRLMADWCTKPRSTIQLPVTKNIIVIIPLNPAEGA
jgi:hypothetical protein